MGKICVYLDKKDGGNKMGKGVVWKVFHTTPHQFYELLPPSTFLNDNQMQTPTDISQAASSQYGLSKWA